MIYLDHAATTPVSPEVREAMRPYFEGEFGNPSSRHPLGVAAARAVERARNTVATALGAEPRGVIFTSGGTEANNLGVLGFARSRGEGEVWVGSTEHSCVGAAVRLLAREGYGVHELPLDGQGDLELGDLEGRLGAGTRLVTAMVVNNVVGTHYDIPRLARRVRALAPGAHLHVDAVQALGKVEVSLDELGVDSLAISAHKIHGPKGVGALVLAPGRVPTPLLVGGGQEGGHRSGTENVAGIVGLATAVREAVDGLAPTREHLRALRTQLADGLGRVPGARLLGFGSSSAPHVCALSLPGPPAEVWMHHLETHGIYTSVGSACQARDGKVPAVFAAVGLGQDEARQVLRVSFSKGTTPGEVEAALAGLAAVSETLGACSP